MLHTTDQNLQSSSGQKTIKLSVNQQTQPVTRTLKSTVVTYKDSLSHNKNNDMMQNRSMNLEKKDSGLEGSAQKIHHIGHPQQPQITSNTNQWSTGLQNQNHRESLLAASREIKRVSTELNENLHQSHQKSLNSSQNRFQFRTPVLRKD